MPFQIIRDDITNVTADVIVNTANPHPVCGSGTDHAIYEAAGREQLLAARKRIGEILPGQVAVTDAFGLKARYIFHTVGPGWKDGNHGEFTVLKNCYQNCLEEAVQRHCHSIAFPLIATGNYGFPKDRALQIAISVISRFLLEQELDVLLVVFDRTSFELSGKLFSGINSFIDEHYVEQHRECYQGRLRSAELESICFESALPASNSPSLEDAVKQAGETFQQQLFQLIDSRGLSDSAVYKKANIDRKLFSKIRCNPDYTPRKNTILALAIALELSLPETEKLLRSAGIALSPSCKADLIVEYFINQKIYDVFQINTALFEYGQPLLCN